jgi:hypothetical protein
MRGGSNSSSHFCLGRYEIGILPTIDAGWSYSLKQEIGAFLPVRPPFLEGGKMPVGVGPIPSGFHVKTKNGYALVTEFDQETSMVKVLYGIQDNRRIEESIRFSEIEEWIDKGFA